jgi:penicillin amidase
MGLSRFLLRLALGKRLPTTSGELRVRGPGAPVTVRRDRWGVPHIDAASEPDATFALGFCQGQDRAGQLELFWRLVRGRLAEWLGPAALPADRASRRIGFRRGAEAQLAALAPGVRLAFESFALGVTAGTTAGLPKKPHEFALAGGAPSPWDAADALGVVKLQSFMLPSNWDVELARLRVLLADGEGAMLALDPTEEPNPPTPFPRREGGAGFAPPSLLGKGVGGLGLLADLDALRAYLPRGGGSNNWAVSGARTASGKPVLASDPHLAPTCPAPWYLAHARWPQAEVIGAALAGTPGFPIGHNGFAAWGVTAGLTDNSDFFIETLGPDGRSVRESDGTFAPCEVVKEVIAVKGAADVVEEVLVTPRGPVLSGLVPDAPFALSLSAIWLQPRPLVGFFGAPGARSFDEFRAHFAAWPVLPLNVLYADTAGTIGWQLVGEVPTRAGGSGLLPRPADAPDSGWTGTVPFEQMPFAVNPDCGYLATANDDPQSKGAWLGADFIDDYRARRIRERLAARDSGWTAAEVGAIQMDVQSIPWREMRDAVLALAPSDVDARCALDLLAPWDGQVTTDSPAAAVFELFSAELCVRVAKAKAPKAWATALGKGAMGLLRGNLFGDRRISHLSKLVREQPAGWFASWPAEMEGALAAAVRELRRVAGPGPGFWAWGHLRTLRLAHPLFGKHKWLGPAFNRGPVPWGGDCNTVSQAGALPMKPTDHTHNIANLRCVFDLDNLALSTFVLCGGQSGNPLSPHHADQFPLWQRGESVTLPWDQPAVVRAAVNTLRLLPQ